MNSPKTTLLLNLETFNNQGGVQRVSRVLAKALSTQTTLVVHSLYDGPGQVDLRYVPSTHFHAYSGNKFRFFLKALAGSLRAETVVLSHINLLLLALAMKLFNPRLKVILLAHGVEVWRPLSNWKRSFIKQHIQTWAVSQFTAKRLEMQIGRSRHPIRVLNNCLDPFFRIPHQLSRPKYLEEKYQLKADARVLFCLSRLSSYDAEKGYDKLLYALPALLQKHPNITYLLAGQATQLEQSRLKDLIITQGLEDHVILAGPISEEELTDHYLLADVFVLCSTKEGFGLALIEAAACGSPIICGNVDGSIDAVLNGQMATLINPHHIGQLEKAVLHFFKQDNNKLGQQQKCLQHFGYEAYVQKLGDLLGSKPINSRQYA